VERVPACDLSFQGAVSVTPFDRSLEEGLRRTWSPGTPPGVVSEDGVNFLLDQADSYERRIYVVRGLLSCGGEKGQAAACTRVSEPTTVIDWFNANAITLLHELGRQVGLGDGSDPRLLMYRGRPVPRVGTGLKPAELRYFRRLLPPS
jgi:hypothetical protein